METNQVNVPELCSRLYRFRFPYDEQDTDVTIGCEGQKFLCHRAVLAAKSAYFERMFNSNTWTENVTGSVVLAGDDVKATALLEIFKYMYVGYPIITSSNFIDLLYAGHYLDVLGLEAHCVRVMLRNRPDPTVDLLEVLFFAHSAKNHSLIDVLASCNMTERLKKFFSTTEFLDINKDLFLTIVSKLWKSSPITNEVLRRAIYRWKVHAPEERKQDALELYEVLESASKIWLDHSIGSSLEVYPDFYKTVAATPNPSLFVYSNDEDHRTKVYRYNGMNLRFKKFGLEQSFIHDSKIRPTRFVSVDNVGVFSMAYEPENYSHPIFTQFASANICRFEHGLALAGPPVNMYHDFDLCNLSNRGLYLLLRKRLFRMPPLRDPAYDASKQKFTHEEIDRGIYFYNIELDRWYPVPVMISDAHESCMTALDNMLYVISSEDDRRMVQVYDHRERMWNCVPEVPKILTNAQSCVLDGSIYVRSATYCGRFDPKAAKWEDIGGFRKSFHQVSRIISYKNQLWQFRKRGARRVDHFIEVYDPPTASWSFIPGKDAFDTMSRDLNEQVVDAVVW